MTKTGRIAVGLLLGLLAVALTAAPAVAKKKTVTKTFSSGTLTTPLTDDRITVATVTVPKKQRGKIKDVDALVRLNHAFDADVFMALVAPNGRFANLTTDNGGAGDNFGAGANDCSGIPTTFDDSAATAITGLGLAAAPFAGAFRPQDPLSVFNGGQTTFTKNRKGTWYFVVGDDNAPNTGVLGCVKLKIKYAKVVKKKKKK